MQTYEAQLNADSQWALREGSMHFERESAVQKSLEKITRKLEELQIPYAVAGGMALFFHGYRRFTEDIDILISREGLERLRSEVEGRGYVRPFEKSKQLRDTEYGVRIEFLLEGDFPGDGLPKPVSFPPPSDVSVVIDGMRFLGLETLVQLKLASGTVVHRMKDLVDVQELIKTLQLPEDLADRLDASVRDQYRTLWKNAQVSDPIQPSE